MDETIPMFDLAAYTDASAVSIGAARRLLAQVEWLDNPDSDDGDLWWTNHKRAMTEARKLGADAVVNRIAELGNPHMISRHGVDDLGVKAVLAARNFLRSKETA